MAKRKQRQALTALLHEHAKHHTHTHTRDREKERLIKSTTILFITYAIVICIVFCFWFSCLWFRRQTFNVYNSAST